MSSPMAKIGRRMQNTEWPFFRMPKEEDGRNYYDCLLLFSIVGPNQFFYRSSFGYQDDILFSCVPLIENEKDRWQTTVSY